MLRPFIRPVHGQAQFSLWRQLSQRLRQHRIRQALGSQPLVMQQARQAFERRLLIAQAAC